MHALKIGNIQGLAGASALQCITIHIYDKIQLQSVQYIQMGILFTII